MNSFLPSILLENVKRREIRKHIRYYLKRDSVKLSESLVRQESTYGSGQQCECPFPRASTSTPRHLFQPYF